MNDRKKVIKGLAECAGNGNCTKCQYGKEKQALSCKKLLADALALLKENCHNCKLECLLQKYDELKEKYDVLLKEQEEVVRCKDCKECYFASNRIQSEQTFACGKHGIDVTQDWFCADGERK